MNPKPSWRTVLGFGLGLAMLLGQAMVLPSAAALDDAYLRMLEAESNDVSVVEESVEESGRDVPEEGPALDLGVESASGEFETTLRDYYPGSYRLFNKLDADGQRRVLDEFARNGSISSATRLILRLSID